MIYQGCSTRASSLTSDLWQLHLLKAGLRKPRVWKGELMSERRVRTSGKVTEAKTGFSLRDYLELVAHKFQTGSCECL